MGFIISNLKIEKSTKIKNIYIKGNFTRIDDYILVFKGYLFRETKLDEKLLLEKIIKNGIRFIEKIRGNFCGVICNLKEKQIYFFTDRFRYFDLFYHFSKGFFIISDKFAEILKTRLFSITQVNIQALFEFVIFEYPLLEKTFINDINFVPLGTIFHLDLFKKNLTKEIYYNLIFKPNLDFYKNKNYDNLGKKFDRAIKRIKELYPPHTVYGLGLSGGLDSRLTAFLAKRHKMNLKTFIFGEKNSDAYYISNKIAKKLNLNHHELGFRRDFYKFAEEGINYNPMMSLYYMWYYAIYKHLPKFDVLLTGFFGGGAVGALLTQSDLKISNNIEFADQILNHFLIYDLGKEGVVFFREHSLLSKVKENLIEFSKKSPNHEFWQKIEEFNLNRQLLYIKNNPSFNFYGLFEITHSIFVDQNIVEVWLGLPPDLRMNRNYYYNFFRVKIPSMYKIRRERELPEVRPQILKKILRIIRRIDVGFNINLIFKKDHKRVVNWVSNYSAFIKYVKSIISKENSCFNNIFDNTKMEVLFSKKQWTKSETCLVFRFLTIKLFLDKMKNDWSKEPHKKNIFL